MRHVFEPMLAEPADEPFNSKDWIFEIKWDGIRAISYVNSEFSIRSRNGNELASKFPELEELRQLARGTVVDGEIVVMREGKPDFQKLIERIKAMSAFDVQQMASESPATYVVFDILERESESTIKLPLMKRKEVLAGSVKEGDHVALSVYVEEQGEEYFKAALRKGLEGIIGKKKDSPYQPGVRSGYWLKIKRIVTCDCVIFGYTKGEGNRRKTFGALLLGLYNEKTPVFVGKVGTGFTQVTIGELLQRFKGLEVKEQTLEGVHVPEQVTWLKPEIVCEIAYQNVTNDGKLRMPRFRGPRLDKTASECTLQQLKQGTLSEYRAKRNFKSTPEPVGRIEESQAGIFVVQEHHARRLHHDLRLEKDGTLKSWAVPKGLPQRTGERRLAIQTEDHPLEYSRFEGTIPEGQYGAGEVTIWDKGSYQLKIWDSDKIEFFLKGRRLSGRYVLAKFKKAGEKQWILLKTRD
jgi:DNA ligase D-like protein (predicted ligase)/DNA ligase D-like protein (predicted 3'-phosphoesterase)